MKKEDKKILIGLAAVGVGYYVIHSILVKLGIVKSHDEVVTQQQQQQAPTTIVQEIQTTQPTLKPTKSVAEWNMIANLIYQDLRYTSLDDNKNDAMVQMCRIQNNLDYAILVQQFGYRQEYYFGIPAGDKKNLPAFITSNLNATQIATINSNYQRKGVKFRL